MENNWGDLQVKKKDTRSSIVNFLAKFGVQYKVKHRWKKYTQQMGINSFECNILSKTEVAILHI